MVCTRCQLDNPNKNASEIKCPHEWIDYCNTPLPHNLKFENVRNVVEAMGKTNDMNDVVVYVIEKNIFDTYAFIKLIGTARGWVSIETYFFAVPLKMAREMLKLKMSEW